MATGTVSAVVNFGQWNLRHSQAHNDAGTHAWSYRRPLLASTVINSGVGVLSAQEIDLPGTADDQGAQLLASLRAAAPTQDWQYQATGRRNGMFWRADQYHWDGAGGLGPSVFPERELAWVHLTHKATGLQFIAASDHWHPGVVSTRLGQAESAHAMLSYLKEQWDCPVILGVDTNDYGLTWGQAIGIMTASVFTDLRTVFPAARRSEWPTWHNWVASPPWTDDGNSKGEWIDQIFISTPAHVLSGGIWDTTLPLTTGLYSDHHFLTAEIELTHTTPDSSTPTMTAWVATHTGLPSFNLIGPGTLAAGGRVIASVADGEQRLVSDAGAELGAVTEYEFAGISASLTRTASPSVHQLLTDSIGRSVADIRVTGDDQRSWDPGTVFFQPQGRADPITRDRLVVPSPEGTLEVLTDAEGTRILRQLIRAREALWVVHNAAQCQIPGCDLEGARLIKPNGQMRESRTARRDQATRAWSIPYQLLTEATGAAPVVTWGDWDQWDGTPSGWQNWSLLEVCRRITGMP